MRYSMQLEKIIKRPLLLAVIAAFAAGCSNAKAEDNTQQAHPPGDDPFQSRIVGIQLADGSSNPASTESHSDSDMAAKNWDNADGPDTHAVAPSMDDGMAAVEWRSLEQTVSHNDSYMAAKNWNNADGPDMQEVAPSNEVGMAAAEWRSLDQPVFHSDSDMAAKNWNNPDGPDTQAVQPSVDDGMAAKNWKETQ